MNPESCLPRHSSLERRRETCRRSHLIRYGCLFFIRCWTFNVECSMFIFFWVPPSTRSLFPPPVFDSLHLPPSVKCKPTRLLSGSTAFKKSKTSPFEIPCSIFDIHLSPLSHHHKISHSSNVIATRFLKSPIFNPFWGMCHSSEGTMLNVHGSMGINLWVEKREGKLCLRSLPLCYPPGLLPWYASRPDGRTSFHPGCPELQCSRKQVLQV